LEFLWDLVLGAWDFEVQRKEEMVKDVAFDTIKEEVARLCMEANFYLGEDVIAKLKEGLDNEVSPTAKDVLKMILDNAEISRTERVPMCQDTGFSVFFVEMGQEVHVTGGAFEDAVNAGVRKGYTDGYLRKSILKDPIRGSNSGDNTPAIIHTRIVPGDQLRIIIAPKGGGSENMSEVNMMKPADGIEGIKNWVIDRVRRSGANPCPPIVVGVGIGGTFEQCALLAKKALLRRLDAPHPDPFYDAVEKELLERVNNLGIGPQGFGGRTTALAVHVNAFPRHIATFPAAVNINCHAARHKEVVL
jgi:fumarate hydratase subunit alpha